MDSQLIPSQRHLFDIPEGITYLNISYMSPLMKRSAEQGQKGIWLKARPWEVNIDHFFASVEEARRCFARLVHAEPDDIAIIPSASYGVTTACRNIRMKEGQELLIQEGEFPSIYYPFKKLALDSGAKLVIAPHPSNGDWTSSVLKMISEKTAAVAISPAHWMDGSIVDLEKVSAKCSEYGSKLILDACQSLGAMQLDLRKIKASYVVAPTYKWLLGPYSFGFLYVHPTEQNGTPLEEYWASKAGGDDFVKLASYPLEYAKGARRFDMGQRSNFHTLPVAVSALEQIFEWGIDNIQRSIKILTDVLAEEVVRKGYQVLPPEYRCGHILGVRKPGGYPADIVQRLQSQHIFVSLRGDSLRISPHLFNDLKDIDRLVRAL